jgi:hypothetical protein
LAVAACTRSHAATAPFADASDLFREIHERYVGKRFTHVTFVQRTEPAEGEVKLWYEAIWYDREHLYPHRVIQPPGASPNRVEFRMLRYQFLEGGWIENRIDILVGGRVVTTECYDQVRPHPGLPEDLYDPATFATRLWAAEAYPDVHEPPACSST